MSADADAIYAQLVRDHGLSGTLTVVTASTMRAVARLLAITEQPDLPAGELIRATEAITRLLETVPKAADATAPDLKRLTDAQILELASLVAVATGDAPPTAAEVEALSEPSPSPSSVAFVINLQNDLQAARGEVVVLGERCRVLVEALEAAGRLPVASGEEADAVLRREGHLRAPAGNVTPIKPTSEQATLEAHRRDLQGRPGGSIHDAPGARGMIREASLGDQVPFSRFRDLNAKPW
jgi:hypothetical protein